MKEFLLILERYRVLYCPHCCEIINMITQHTYQEKIRMTFLCPKPLTFVGDNAFITSTALSTYVVILRNVIILTLHGSLECTGQCKKRHLIVSRALVCTHVCDVFLALKQLYVHFTPN